MTEEEKEDIELATRTQRVLEFIYSTIKENGEISQFKEDVLCVVSELLERLSNKEKQYLTATEIVNRQYQANIQREKERRLEEQIQRLQKEIEELQEVKISVNAINQIDKLQRDFDQVNHENERLEKIDIEKDEEIKKKDKMINETIDYCYDLINTDIPNVGTDDINNILNILNN